MLLPISAPVLEATRQRLADPTTGLNALIAANAAAFGVAVFTIDLTAATSIQYWQVNAGPDDMEESTPSKYPMLFHYTAGSSNDHENYGSTTFSGPVDQRLEFYFTDKSTRMPRSMEKIGDLIEAAVNSLLTNGNWPQLYGVNAVCTRYPMARGPLEMAGESWRQAFSFRLTLTTVVP